MISMNDVWMKGDTIIDVMKYVDDLSTYPILCTEKNMHIETIRRSCEENIENKKMPHLTDASVDINNYHTYSSGVAISIIET